MRTFLAPFDDECAQLARGVSTYNARTGNAFDLRAYRITERGDILAIEKTLGIKGHNAVIPCRSCFIEAVRDTSLAKSPYYACLTRPHTPGHPSVSIDPSELKLRTHKSFARALSKINNAPTKTKAKAYAKEYGIREAPALTRVNSIDLARAVPWDWMHLVLENIIPNLVALWKGEFKGLDDDIMKICLQFVITFAEIDALEVKIHVWVNDYERLYYQYCAERLPVCVLSVHGLLHVPDNIRFCGPEWSSWTFDMERYCGFIKQGLNSRNQPWTNITKRIRDTAYLSDLAVRYDLNVELQLIGDKNTEKASRFERKYDGCETMPTWDGVRIAEGGDKIRCHREGGRVLRDMSHVRYELEVQDNRGQWVRNIFYGRLEKILVCQLDNQNIWGTFQQKTVILALVSPCAGTNGQDAARTPVFFKTMTTSVVIDLCAISAAVGTPKTATAGGRFGILDRTGGLVRTTFVDDVGSDDESEEE
ncbi:hypothetical protein C8J56DRAFT_781342 [Mycena floridula]|nr:hypothetical protein C8J56DRAFT_781342 [Mycena floridula]